MAAGAGAVGLDAHGFEEAGETIDPGVGMPAGVGKEEIEAAVGGGGGGRAARTWCLWRVFGEEIGAGRQHDVGEVEASGMPEKWGVRRDLGGEEPDWRGKSRGF